jgi:UDP-N-acetylglucosamine--N-acetylmuramyl-(pentapeptide) pyrophosphoryl-undecaprenol N-acetylglucosamine transferase
LKQIKPQVVATFGGYASLPTGLAAASLRLRLLVHEQNARPGLANRVLARRADVLALTDERAAAGIKTSARIQITGNPLRPELLGVDRLAARERLGFTDAGLILLVFGGSLGAHHLNSAVLNLATELLVEFSDLQVLHLAGSLDYQWANQMLQDQQIPATRWHLMEYCHQMGDAYAAADLVLSRAGASSLAEITALGKAALLVPYPFAVADEQTANAQKLEEADAARVWPDRELDNPGFSELLKSLLAEPLLRQAMANRALALSKPDANRAIAQLILELAAQPEIVQPTGE